MTKDILLSITGMTPQVVTETLYAIYKQEPDRFPEEIYIITTKRGAEKIRTTLLGDGGMLNRFCSEYGLPQIEFDESRHLKIICDKNGTLIDDARSKEDQQVIADFIFNEVRKLTQAKENGVPYYRIHASLAGGRKTMTYLLGSSMNILGNPEDRLSHVLVSEAFETCSEFFYPTKETHLIHGRYQEELDAAQAKVELSEIPLMFLRTLLDPEKSQSYLTSYTNAVKEINSSLKINKNNLKLTVICSNCSLLINNEVAVQLEPREFTIYKFIVNRIKQNLSFQIPKDVDYHKAGYYQSFVDAIKLLFELLSSVSLLNNFKNEKYLSIIKEGKIKQEKVLHLLRDKYNEQYPEDFVKLSIKPENIDIYWLNNIVRCVNEIVEPGDFIQTEKDPYYGLQSYNILVPFVRENGDIQLNKQFLKSQVRFWNNSVKKINEKIKGSIKNIDMAEHYTIRTVSNSSRYKGVDLFPENIIFE